MYDYSRSTTVKNQDNVYEVLQYAKLYYNIAPFVNIRPFAFEDRINYLVEDEMNAKRMFLRIIPPYYQKSDIMSELAWMNDIKNNTDILVPEPMRGVNGQYVQIVAIPNVNARYHCVLFNYFMGQTLDECEDFQIKKKFKKLGEITAKLHQNSILFEGVKKQVGLKLDYDALLGGNARFGIWHNSPEITMGMDSLFNTVSKIIKYRLERYGMSSRRFGLINSNMSLSNIMMVQNKVSVTNFEGCGLGWYLYDFASAVNCVDTDMNFSDLFTSWYDGYKKYRKLNWIDLGEVFTFVMFSRLFSLCKKLNAEYYGLYEKLEPDFLEKTVALANEYLKRYT